MFRCRWGRLTPVAVSTNTEEHTHTFDNHSHRAGVPKPKLAPITGILPRSLWPHDVVVWVRSSARGVYDDAGSLRGIRRSQGRSTPRRRGLFIETPFPALCKDARRRPTTSRSTRAGQSSQRSYGLYQARRRAEEAHSDGLRQQIRTTARPVGGRTDDP